MFTPKLNASTIQTHKVAVQALVVFSFVTSFNEIKCQVQSFIKVSILSDMQLPKAFCPTLALCGVAEPMELEFIYEFTILNTMLGAKKFVWLYVTFQYSNASSWFRLSFMRRDRDCAASCKLVIPTGKFKSGYTTEAGQFTLSTDDAREFNECEREIRLKKYTYEDFNYELIKSALNRLGVSMIIFTQTSAPEQKMIMAIMPPVVGWYNVGVTSESMTGTRIGYFVYVVAYIEHQPADAHYNEAKVYFDFENSYSYFPDWAFDQLIRAIPGHSTPSSGSIKCDQLPNLTVPKFMFINKEEKMLAFALSKPSYFIQRIESDDCYVNVRRSVDQYWTIGVSVAATPGIIFHKDAENNYALGFTKADYKFAAHS